VVPATAAVNRHPEHNFRSEATSHSHGLSKSARSRSSGRQRQHGHSTDGAVAVNSGRRTPQESNFGNSANRQYSEEWTSSRSETNSSNLTQTTAEDSSLKSSASPDATTSEKEGSHTSGIGPFFSTPKHLLYPPPPPKPTLNTMGQSSQDNNSSQGKHQSRQQNSDPIQLLKKLGRKLAIETEATGGASCPPDDLSIGMRSTATSSRRPQTPKQVRDYQNSSHNSAENMKNDAFQGRENARSFSSKDLSQKKRQQQIERSPSLLEATESVAALRAEEMNDGILEEASEMIARMGRLTNSEQTSLRTRKSRRQKIDGFVGDTAADAAFGKLARAERRKERAEKMASELRLWERLSQHSEDGKKYTLPMNVVMTTRGRAEMCMDDILKEAAEVRARARRSASRSRERVKEAATFCGEAPSENTGYEGQSEDDQTSLSSERRRSILNPHGLKDQPRPPAIERRSQSRERKRNTSGDSKLPARERRTGRNANQDKDLGYMQLSTAEELLSRRREMRQMIKDRQSHLKEQMLEESSSRPSRWVDETIEQRRGRSRSAIRDGFSKIRSASSRALRKKDNETIGEDESKTIDSGRQSTFSFKSLLSIGSRRSLSRGRSRKQRGFGVDDDWEGSCHSGRNREGLREEGRHWAPTISIKSTPLLMNDSLDYGQRSSIKSESSSVQSFFKRSLSRTRQPKDSGRARSLSCDRFDE
jgi:hypothetical protein